MIVYLFYMNNLEDDIFNAYSKQVPDHIHVCGDIHTVRTLAKYFHVFVQYIIKLY